MKYLKTYEIWNHPLGKRIFDYIEKGDYVLLQLVETAEHRLYGKKPEYLEFEKFINNTIGKIVGFNGYDDLISVRYENVPDNIKKNFSFSYDIFYTKTESIRYWGKSKEEIEAKIEADKYNL